MIVVHRYKTLDGQLHPDEPTARKHAERRYADALSRIAREVIALAQHGGKDRLLKVQTYLDTHTGALADLGPLKADAVVVLCPECRGSGEVETGIGMMTCDTCRGTGSALDKGMR
jgi:DnaJ-class molecular chaperone